MTVIGGNFYEVQAVYLSTEQPAKDGHALLMFRR